MLVQEIPRASAVVKKKPARGSALYGRAAPDSSAQQARTNRHLAELEQDNYHAIQIDIPKPESMVPSALYKALLTFSTEETAQDNPECAEITSDEKDIDESLG
jgi:hypothetical protein